MCSSWVTADQIFLFRYSSGKNEGMVEETRIRKEAVAQENQDELFLDEEDDEPADKGINTQMNPFLLEVILWRS